MIPSLIGRLRRRGVRLRLEEDRIRVRGEISDEERSALVEHREAVVRILKLDAVDGGYGLGVDPEDL